MNIEFDKYIIETDRHNYILLEKSIYKSGKKKGEKYNEVISYHRTLGQVVNKLLDLKIKESERVELEKIETWFALINDYIHEAINSIKES